MKLYRKLICLILALSLLCMLPVTVYAHEIPDESRKGTITVDMAYDGKAVTGGTLTAYRVGQIRESNGDYIFLNTPDTDEFSGEYDSISDLTTAESMAVFVKEHGLPAYAAAENTGGKAVFTDLELGLYLIVQTERSNGYEPLKPFLVSVPMNENGGYIYEINAVGKFQLRQTTNTDEPSKPVGSTLPYTGQLNWPIPVLAVLGLVLFAMGWGIRFGRKKNSYEE